MKYVADIHIHSHYSRATSKNLNIETLAIWAQRKGVHLLATGDIAHPGWLREIKETLDPAEDGLFKLKPDIANRVEEQVFPACRNPIRFMLGGEISNIYKKGGKVRKVHNLVYAPTIESVEKLQAALEKIGNIRSDGRPILGLSSHDLLEITLNIDPQNYFIPAHIWTPWFALLGSKSGYDSVEECFGDLTSHIFALETGLSTDPPMNQRLSMLDNYTLVSNSDAHSPQKLAREANVLDTELSYEGFFDALKTGDKAKFLHTIEFFPEEGKYHFDGHRKCQIRWLPQTTIEHDGLCSVCGKPVTVGTLHRIEELADRPANYSPKQATKDHAPPIEQAAKNYAPPIEQAAKSNRSHVGLIPLPEILGEVHSVGPKSKRVSRAYESLLEQLGPELIILQETPLEEIAAVGGTLLAEGIKRVRSGNVYLDAGYDGEYGTIHLFSATDRENLSGQLSLIDVPLNKKLKKNAAEPSRTSQKKSAAKTATVDPVDVINNADSAASVAALDIPDPAIASTAEPLLKSKLDLLMLNPQQLAAVQCIDRSLLITAGPGTGKTRTLTYRIAHLVADHSIPAAQILAVTFTNKAAQEMSERLSTLLDEATVKQLTVKTFHAFGAMILRQYGKAINILPEFAIITEAEQRMLIKQIDSALSEREINQVLEQISAVKNQLQPLSTDSALAELSRSETVEANAESVEANKEISVSYNALLAQNNLLDFDDLIARTVELLEQAPDVLATIHTRYRWISIDEYQDVNAVQVRLLYLLVNRETDSPANLCAIGDPDQAIYGFRGADRAYFLQFEQDFPRAQRIELTQSYRSTQLILDASEQVVSKQNIFKQKQNSSEREHDMPSFEQTATKKLWSQFVDRTPVQIHAAPTDKAEAEQVVHQIEQLVGGTSYFSIDSGRVDDRAENQRSRAFSFADFAVLHRIGAQSNLLVEAFARSGIPFQAISQAPLTEHKEIRQILAALWWLVNPNDLHLIQAIGRAKPPKKLLAHTQDALSPLRAKVDGDSVVLIKNVAAALLPDPAAAVQERIDQLVLRAISFDGTLIDFLDSTALTKEADIYDPRADRVTIMTLHASKGLEFPVVFIVGCEENLLPYVRPNINENVANEEPEDLGESRTYLQQNEIDEERRLFYVGMTRAEQRLILTHAHNRFWFGQRVENPVSRFVADIEERLKALNESVGRKKKKEKPEDVQLSLF